MRLSGNHLASALVAWMDYGRTSPDEQVRLLRQPGHFLVTGLHELNFSPIRLLLSWCDGVAFSQKGGRSVNMADWTERLAAIDVHPICEGDDDFERLYQAWEAQCLASGKPLANYVNPSPRTERTFWLWD